MNRLRKLVSENVGLKLLALALAVALWAAVGSDPVTEATFRVPLEFINAPSNVEVLADQPTVQLWARGPSHLLRQSTAADFAVRVSVASMAAPGELTFSLDPGSVAAPTPLRVIQLMPSEVRVTLEHIVSKDIPIDPQFSGAPAPGYRLKQFLVKPPLAKISGPDSHVSSITSASTDPIELTRLTDKKTFVTNTYVSDPLVRFIRPSAVEVTVEVEATDVNQGIRNRE